MVLKEVNVGPRRRNPEPKPETPETFVLRVYETKPSALSIQNSKPLGATRLGLSWGFDRSFGLGSESYVCLGLGGSSFGV